MLLSETLLRDLRQPEYIHVLLNPLPVYGLLTGLIGLVLALVLKSRRAEIATLTLVLISSASAWPVYEFGQQGYDRVLSMTDEDGGAWLDEHMHRAEAAHLDFLCSGHFERNCHRRADQMAQILAAARSDGRFARGGDFGKRGLYRLRRWKNPSSRISKRTCTTEKIRKRALSAS